MGLEIQEIAQRVVDNEPPQCPFCGNEDPFDSAAASVVRDDENDSEALIISYHCARCGVVVHTFA